MYIYIYLNIYTYIWYIYTHLQYNVQLYIIIYTQDEYLLPPNESPTGPRGVWHSLRHGRSKGCLFAALRVLCQVINWADTATLTENAYDKAINH